MNSAIFITERFEKQRNTDNGHREMVAVGIHSTYLSDQLLPECRLFSVKTPTFIAMTDHVRTGKAKGITSTYEKPLARTRILNTICSEGKKGKLNSFEYSNLFSDDIYNKTHSAKQIILAPIRHTNTKEGVSYFFV